MPDSSPRLSSAFRRHTRHSLTKSIAAWLLAALPLAAAEPVTQKIDLLDVMRQGEMEYHINSKADFHDPAAEVFKLADGQLQISGRGYGYMVTKRDFRDYHLVVEFKWGAKTWGKRADRARDNGILLHAFGPHGAFADTWMASIEAQIIEGGIGDILVLSPKLPDGTKLTASVSSEFELDRDKEKVWKKGSPRQTVTEGRINWAQRDIDWADKLNFRGKNDPDSPVGEWNRLEVIAKGDQLQYFVNGRLVNEASAVTPSEGRICIQTEGAEMIVRRYELWPLGQFKEQWKPLTREQPTEPASNKTVAYRTMLPDSGPSSIAVGLPGKIGFCYDPNRGGINYIWRGDFVDLEPTWKGKINQPATIRGEIIYREKVRQPLRINSVDREPTYQFKGYRLSDDAIEVQYTLDEVQVREEIRASNDGTRLVRRFQLDAPCEKWWFLSEPQSTVGLSSLEGAWNRERQAFTGVKSREFTMLVDVKAKTL